MKVFSAYSTSWENANPFLIFEALLRLLITDWWVTFCDDKAELLQYY